MCALNRDKSNMMVKVAARTIVDSDAEFERCCWLQSRLLLVDDWLFRYC